MGALLPRMLLRAMLIAEPGSKIWRGGRNGLALQKKVAFSTFNNHVFAPLHLWAFSSVARRPGAVEQDILMRFRQRSGGRRGFSASSDAKSDSFGTRGKLMLLLGGLGGLTLAYAWHTNKEKPKHKRPRVLDPPHGFSDDFRHPYKVRPACAVHNTTAVPKT